MSALVTLDASSSVMPLIISVRAEDEAMAEAQPNVWNFTSAMRSFFSSSLKASLRASPQASAPTWPTPSGFSIVPTLRGWWKWSRTFSE